MDIVVGAGIAGVACARRLAEHGRMVRVLERKPFIGGSCRDVYDENGILIHPCGPHIFHTNNDDVWAFLSRFTEWTLFRHKVVAKIGTTLLPVPFNLHALEIVYGKTKAAEIEEKLISRWGAGARVPILDLQNEEDPDLHAVAKFVYENIFLKYTVKLWGRCPEEIDASVMARVPVVLSRDDEYFTEKYQGVPKDGYTRMMKAMLAHDNIMVETGTDYMGSADGDGHTVYTGAIDELCSRTFGSLPYRSIRFETEYLDMDDYQGQSVVNYTVSEDFTRITEFKHLTKQSGVHGTTIMREYPTQYEEGEGLTPFYPIRDEESNALYEKYVSLLSDKPRFHLLGRLAEYRYYNMDDAVQRALALADDIAAQEQTDK